MAASHLCDCAAQCRSTHAQAAVDVQHVAGDVAGFVAGQKNDGRGDLRVRPMRPSGMRASSASFTFCGSGSVIGETMKPGATAFTVMFREATSTAIARVKPISPAFAAT